MFYLSFYSFFQCKIHVKRRRIIDKFLDLTYNNYGPKKKIIGTNSCVL